MGTLKQAHGHEEDELAGEPSGLLRYARCILSQCWLELSTVLCTLAGVVVGHCGDKHAGRFTLLAAVAAGRQELVRRHRGGDIDGDTLRSRERDMNIEEIGALASRVWLDANTCRGYETPLIAEAMPLTADKVGGVFGLADCGYADDRFWDQPTLRGAHSAAPPSSAHGPEQESASVQQTFHC